MCRFDTLLGFLNCCGAIDAAHVIMTLPAVETSDDWYGRERNYSMFLQGIAVHEMRFLDIVKGWPGGLTVPRLLKCSGFSNSVRMENVCMATQAFYLKERKPESILSMGIGYPLPPWLITPEAVMESQLPCPLSMPALKLQG
jgi:hypothetical protein